MLIKQKVLHKKCFPNNHKKQMSEEDDSCVCHIFSVRR